MTKPVTIGTSFSGVSTATGAQLDGNFNALAAAVNDPLTYNNYLVDTGAANAYVVTFPAGTVPAAYTAGLSVQMLVANVNTGASTINVNGLGLKNIVSPGGAALVAGQLPASGIVQLMYDGTNFQLITIAYVSTTIAITGDVKQTFATVAPSGWYLIPNAAQAAVSRSGTYAGISGLMATLGYPFGAGDGSTTFVMPWIPTGYTWVQAVTAATAGALTHGAVIAHSHTNPLSQPGVGAAGGSTPMVSPGAQSSSPYGTGSTGGPDNLAAGLGINYMIKL